MGVQYLAEFNCFLFLANQVINIFDCFNSSSLLTFWVDDATENPTYEFDSSSSYCSSFTASSMPTVVLPGGTIINNNNHKPIINKGKMLPRQTNIPHVILYYFAIMNVISIKNVYTACIFYNTITCACMYWHTDNDCYKSTVA